MKTFDDHHREISSLAQQLELAIRQAAQDGIRVTCKVDQYTGFQLPELTMQRDVRGSGAAPSGGSVAKR